MLMLAAMLMILTSCERRELYVYGDEFYSVTLDVDWRDYDETNPDGMTVWFYPLDDNATTRGNADSYTNSRKPYRTTTANVRHQDLYLPGGRYQGVVINYSPDEYARQEFLSLDTLQRARVVLTPASYQPTSQNTILNGFPDDSIIVVNKALYGEEAWNEGQSPRPLKHADTGFYTVDNQAEPMASDTLDCKTVAQGEYGDYIPWKQRDTYQQTINLQKLESVPHSIIWNTRIRVYIKEGFNYLWQTPASITGLANGHYLPRHVNTDECSLIAFDAWDTERTGENSGYISTTITCFGLRPASLLGPDHLHSSTQIGKSKYDGKENIDWGAYHSDICKSDALRLNLSFILRDHKTVCTYHFDVGECVVSYLDQLVLRVDVSPEFFEDPDGPGHIILPHVDAYEGADFGADVTPWVDVPPVDIPM
jgi:hypothetical protein